MIVVYLFTACGSSVRCGPCRTSTGPGRWRGIHRPGSFRRRTSSRRSACSGAPEWEPAKASELAMESESATGPGLWCWWLCCDPEWVTAREELLLWL